MAATAALYTLLDGLENNPALIASFTASPGAAVADFAITGHERDAVVTRDLDDFLVLGVVTSIWQLPEVLTGPRPPQTIRDRLLALKAWLQGLLGLGKPPVLVPKPHPRPPQPVPGPGHQPHPHPGGGPDPQPPGPGPDPGPDV
jgi:hypothetical protein